MSISLDVISQKLKSNYNLHPKQNQQQMEECNVIKSFVQQFRYEAKQYVATARLYRDTQNNDMENIVTKVYCILYTLC